MNAKHLFLTLVAAVSCAAYVSAGTATDVISVSTITAKEYNDDLSDGEDFSVASGWTFVSGITYASSNFFFSSDDDYIGVENLHAFATTAGVSGRTVKSISIVWEDGIEDLNDEGGAYSEIKVGARNGTPYTGSETSIDGDEVRHTFTYNDGVTTYNFSSSYEYITLFCRGVYGAFVKSISIVWEWEEFIYYDITAGTITDGVWGTNVIASPTSAKEGDVVTITFAPKKSGSGPKQKKYSLTSYGFDGMVFYLSCTTYPTNPSSYVVKFPMPARDVTIDATFEIVPFASAYLTIDKSVTEVQSGVETVIAFTHLDNNKDGKPFEDFTARYFTATSSDASVLTVDAPVKVSDGNYTFTIHGLATGSVRVTIDAASKGTVNSATSFIDFTVTPREVALLAERSGSYYVMANTVVDHLAAAHEVTYNSTDGRYYYEDGLTLSSVTWNATTVEEGAYAIQNPSSNEYLKYDKGNIEMSASSYSWWKNGEGKFRSSDVNAEGIITNGTSFMAGTPLTNAAVEALIGSNFIPFGTYSTAESTAQIYDSRSLTEGGYGTFCSPYDVLDVSTAGAKFYTLTGKVLDGDRLAGVVISEDPVTALEAGHSYLYQVDKGSSAINLEGCMNLTTEAWTGKDGFVGCLTGDGGGTGKISVPAGRPRADGCYVMSGGQLRYVSAGATASARAYRAYFDVGELDEVEPASVPRRCFLRWEEFKGQVGYEDTPTGINEVEEVSVINWNEPVYNIMGIRVGKGATGVLIQNGRKFFVK